MQCEMAIGFALFTLAAYFVAAHGLVRVYRLHTQTRLDDSDIGLSQDGVTQFAGSRGEGVNGRRFLSAAVPATYALELTAFDGENGGSVNERMLPGKGVVRSLPLSFNFPQPRLARILSLRRAATETFTILRIVVSWRGAAESAIFRF